MIRERKTGAQILCEAMSQEGVAHVFGFSYARTKPIYEALRLYPTIEHIPLRHEQACVHAADAVSRSSEKIGVAILNAGPGATNALTGIATAYTDSIPLILISVQVSSDLIGNDAFQEVDTIGITRPCTKHNYLVTKVEDLALTIKKAFYLAQTGRPGPVLIDIANDVLSEKAPFDYPLSVEIRSYHPPKKAFPKQIQKALSLIKSAKRPLILIGGGVVLSKAQAQAKNLIEQLGIPVVTSLQGINGIDSGLNLGFAGHDGSFLANEALRRSDVVLAIGTRLNERLFTPEAKETKRGDLKLIHLDIDPSSISKQLYADVPIVGDAKLAIEQFLALLEDVEIPTYHSWILELETLSKNHQSLRDDKGLSVCSVIEHILKAIDKEALVVTDVGAHQLQVAHKIIEYPKLQLISSAGFGTKGFGLPAAIGAQVANPDRQVVCFTGDGSIQMLLAELVLFKQKRLPIDIFILNNGYVADQAPRLEQPDFMLLAKAYDLPSVKIETLEALQRFLKERPQERSQAILVDVRLTSSGEK